MLSNSATPCAMLERPYSDIAIINSQKINLLNRNNEDTDLREINKNGYFAIENALTNEAIIEIEKDSTETKLDYLTGDYQDIELTDEQKRESVISLCGAEIISNDSQELEDDFIDDDDGFEERGAR